MAGLHFPAISPCRAILRHLRELDVVDGLAFRGERLVIQKDMLPQTKKNPLWTLRSGNMFAHR